MGPTNCSRQIAMSGGSSNVVMASGASGGFYTYAIGGASYFGFSGAVGGTALSAASAHNGFFIGSNQGATGRIDYFDKNNNLTGQFGSGRVLNPISMQTVLAPEPGLWAVIVLGLVAFLVGERRR